MDSLAILLPSEISPIVAIALLATSAVTSFITAAFGIGGGIVLIGILASLLPPAALIPVHGFVQLGSNAGRVALLARHVAWPWIPAFFGGTVIGAMLGGMIAINLPGPAVQAGIGAFILYSIYVGTPDLERGAGWIVGVITSFLSMFFGSTGPFVANYVRTLDFGRMEHVATQALMMTAQHLLKIIAFGLFGFAFGPYLPLIAGMILIGILGTIAGRAVLMRTDDARFRFVLNAVLTLLALRLLWAGLSEMIWPAAGG